MTSENRLFLEAVFCMELMPTMFGSTWINFTRYARLCLGLSCVTRTPVFQKNRLGLLSRPRRGEGQIVFNGVMLFLRALLIAAVKCEAMTEAMGRDRKRFENAIHGFDNGTSRKASHSATESLQNSIWVKVRAT